MSDAPNQQLVAYRVFAATLRPRVTGTRQIITRGGQPKTVDVVSKGSPDEIWLRWLRIKHGAEKHTMSEWQALIDHHASQPAHPHDPNFMPGT